MKLTTLITLSSLLVLAACYGGGSKKFTPAAPVPNQPQENVPTQPDVADTYTDIDIDIDPDIDIDDGIQGQYLAVFETVNPQITGRVKGAFTFSREKESDEVVGDVRVTNAGSPKLIHAQYVRVGTRCPGPLDDKNADGIIDASEAEAVYGKIFFPLDADLSSQAKSDGFFPEGMQYGDYFYNKAAKFTDFIKDLRTPDASSRYYKLGRREPMNIEGRVVVVHGVDADKDLPITVGTTPRLANHQTLPIACGIIKKVLENPGSETDGTYPVEGTIDESIFE